MVVYYVKWDIIGFKEEFSAGPFIYVTEVDAKYNSIVGQLGVRNCRIVNVRNGVEI